MTCSLHQDLSLLLPRQFPGKGPSQQSPTPAWQVLWSYPESPVGAVGPHTCHPRSILTQVLLAMAILPALLPPLPSTK